MCSSRLAPLVTLFVFVSGSAQLAYSPVEDDRMEVKRVMSEQQKLIKLLMADNNDLKARAVELERKLLQQMSKTIAETVTLYGGKSGRYSDTDKARTFDINTTVLPFSEAIHVHSNKRQIDQRIAFHEVLRNSTTFNNHEIIRFDGKELDLGNGFNGMDGIYSAPVAGIYVFKWTVEVASHQTVGTELIVDGVRKGSLHSGSLSGVVPTTAVVVTQVRQGSHIFIRRIGGLGFNMSGQDHFAGTSFSGWLLNQGLAQSQIAFHLALTANKCFNDHEIIKFDNKELDFGNGYTVEDGIYSAPVSGIYVFSWTIVADNHQSVNTELIVNGVKKGSMFSGSLSGIVPGTGVIVTNVNAGSHVFIRKTTGIGCTILGQDSLAGTTFSGWLIFPI